MALYVQNSFSVNIGCIETVHIINQKYFPLLIFRHDRSKFCKIYHHKEQTNSVKKEDKK